MLEPEAFEQQCVILTEDRKPEPDKAWTSKANKAHKEELKQSYEILEQSEYDQLAAMRDRLMGKPAIAPFLEYPTEQEFFASLDGLELKAKPDIYVNPYMVLDLKTTSDASPKHCVREIFNRQYYLQAMYLDVINNCELQLSEKADFGFVFQEKNPPYEATLIWLDDFTIKRGLNEYRRLAQLLQQCYSAGNFPGPEYWSGEFDGSFNLEDL
jgi:hypothetical protein